MFYLILFSVIVYLLYKWAIKDHDYFDKIGLAYEKPYPLVGNMLDIVLQRKPLMDMIEPNYYRHKKDKIFGFFNFTRVSYYILDPEIIKKITIKDFDHFVNHSDEITNADNVFNRSLFALHDKEWKDMRSTLSPIFTSSKMKMMYGHLSDQATNFVKHYEEKAKKEDNLIVEALDTFARFTADGIATSVFGFQTDCVVNKNSETYKIVQKMLHDFLGTIGVLKTVFSFGFPKIYNMLGLQITSREIYDFFKRVVIDVMDERDRKNIFRPDVIQLLLQAKKGQLKTEKENELNEKELTNFAANIEYDLGSKINDASHFTQDDWIAQGFIFFFAGFDTTSNLLQMTCYELAMNVDIQRELQEEVDEQLNLLDGKTISYEALHKMKFLDMVISEALRLWVPAPQVDRACTKDYDIELGNGRSVTIKKGQVINIPIQCVHHDPEYFPEPKKFNPYRFSDENKDSIIPGTYLPFGMGPRICIGSRFALMEAKLLMFNLMSKFNVEKCDKTPEKVTYEPNLFFRIKEKIYLRFKLRK
ncbi:CLUMA_CG016440, isoform A [Clunio marinus]|uniref:CLUMA_CG016440, isoform A n=1 Tax=Clunio marinus TaxID=568069 RepID=A0A1J1IUQ9_9DIPT|nr:CLUMA_CG016440, isoform A [Clunio marinus]